MIGLVLAAALATCTTTDRHERWEAKNRAAPTHAAVLDVGVRDVLAWPVPYVTGWRKRATLVPGEERALRIAGVVRLVKLAKDDCDIHVELAATGAANAPRVIVEVPAGQPAAREQLAAIVGRIGTSARRFEGARAPAIRATCWQFLDLSHQGKAPSAAGHGHGSANVRTLWEGHPCWRIERMQGGER